MKKTLTKILYIRVRSLGLRCGKDKEKTEEAVMKLAGMAHCFYLCCWHCPTSLLLESLHPACERSCVEAAQMRYGDDEAHDETAQVWGQATPHRRHRPAQCHTAYIATLWSHTRSLHYSMLNLPTTVQSTE